MDSSTLPSNSKVPTQAVALLLTALTAWLACSFYTLKLNPEIIGYRQAAALKDRWAEKMTREYGAKVLVYGGSSCAFSIDGERLLQQFNLPTVNYGRAHAIGATVLTESVLNHAGPGDTLIVALEPGLLTDSFELTKSGIPFSFVMHHPEWVMHPVVAPPAQSWFHALASLRPGSYHFFILLGKIAQRKPLMRYSINDFRPSGFEQTQVRMKIDGPAGHGPHLSEDARVMLHNLRDWGIRNKVRIAYSLPWSYTPLERKPDFQKSNIDFLLQINEFIPVLKDPQLGADIEPKHFADTVWHLTEAGSALRTDGFGAQIKNWDIWTAEELHRIKSQL